MWLTTDTCFCVNVPQVILLYLTGVCSVTCPAILVTRSVRVYGLCGMSQTDTCFCVNVPQVILLYLTGVCSVTCPAILVCVLCVSTDCVAHDRHLFLCECATSYSSLSDWCVFCDMPGCLLVCVLCVSMDCVVCDRHLFLCECATSYSSLSDWCVFCDMHSCLRIVWLTTDTCFCVNVPQVILLYLTGVCSVTPGCLHVCVSTDCVAHDRHLFLCECATSYSSLSDWCVFCDMPGCLLVCVLCVSTDCVAHDRHLFLCECATSQIKKNNLWHIHTETGVCREPHNP